MSAATGVVARGLLRADERGLVAAAGVVFALASGGAAMTAAAADAMFLAEVGPAQLGQAVALSSALLAVVLAVVGGLADRLDRRRVLGTLAIVSAVVVAALAALAAVAPRGVAVVTLVGGKQLAAASDLAFWVAIAERVDARRSQRLLPVLAATGGAGAAAGAVLVVPIAAAVGARGVLVAAAALLALAGLLAARLPVSRRLDVHGAGAAVGSRASASLAVRSWASATSVVALIARSWREGARAVRRHPLARHLAIVVGAAGVFGSLAYFALAVGVAARGGDAREFAQLLGGVRGGGQLLVVVVQLAIAPRLLARLGTGRALLVAPAIALAAGCGLIVAPVLAMAIATQVSARVLDAGIETPAEKLTQTLLPSLVRGRVAGFLDGTAKRIGAIAGGLVAAALAGAPAWFYATTAVAALVWLVAAGRIARELPALAIEHVADDDVRRRGDDIAIDERVVRELVDELGDERRATDARAERSADVLARLHERGRLAGVLRIDVRDALARAAIARGSPAMFRALVAVLDAPAEAHGAALLDAARAATSRAREPAVRAVGLAGGVPPEAVAQWRDHEDLAIALAAECARLRLAADRDELVATLADAIRETDETSRAAIDELCAELPRALGDRGSAADSSHALDVARHLTRALRRGRGDARSRAAGYHALVRALENARDRPSAELALLRADLLELARERSDDLTGDAAEIAAALRLYGSLLEGQGAIDPEDLRRVAHALGEADDEVRAAAEDALAALGAAAAGELIATAAWGRRRARDRAAAMLANLPVTPVTLDRLVDAELDALEQTSIALAVLTEPSDALVARRLEERLHEIAHTVLLLVAARRRSKPIAKAAAAWRHARGAHERARTLAVIETALPRPLVSRLVEAVDDLSPADRAGRLAAAPPSREAVIRAELAGRDRLARALVLHALGASGRGAHRDTIARAAHAEALAASASALLRRVTEALDDPDLEGADMPTRVETLIALSRVPLLAPLTTRQLADVAERARWLTAREGDVLVSAGDPVDALIVVDDGELQLGDRRVVKGETVDELACVAPLAAGADLRAIRTSRVIRLERVDFEELVDDVPGLASAVCRALGERARRAADANYRSPLASRAT